MKPKNTPLRACGDTARRWPFPLSFKRSRPNDRRDVIVSTTIPLTVLSFCDELIAQIQDAGFTPVIVSSPGPELDILARRGLQTEAIPMIRGIAPLADAVALVRWFLLMRRRRPHGVLAATPKAALLATVTARLTGVPHRSYLFWGLRLETEPHLRRLALTASERIVGLSATTVVANSPSLAEASRELSLFPRSRLHVTDPGSSHGVDATHFQPRPRDSALLRALDLNPDTLTIGFVGRLTRDKGVDTLIQALHMLSERNMQWQLIVVSPLEERDAHLYKEDLRSLDGAVIFTGPQSEVRPYYTLLDLLALPSRREGFPNVVLEAAAMSIPTITTDATGCKDSVVHMQTGLRHPVGDPENLAAAIMLLSEDGDLRREMGRRARERAVAEFTPQAIVQQTLNVSIPCTNAGHQCQYTNRQPLPIKQSRNRSQNKLG